MRRKSGGNHKVGSFSAIATAHEYAHLTVFNSGCHHLSPNFVQELEIVHGQRCGSRSQLIDWTTFFRLMCSLHVACIADVVHLFFVLVRWSSVKDR